MTNWDQIVHEHGRRVFTLARRISGCTVDAEDVVQDVFFEAYKLDRVEEIRNWPGLLHRLTVHRALDRLRQRHLNVVVDVSTVRRTGADAVQIAVANELAERLREAIGRLPPQQSAVFCLRYFHDVSYEDIGESLGIDRGAVATALYKARQNLKSMLGESN